MFIIDRSHEECLEFFKLHKQQHSTRNPKDPEQKCCERFPRGYSAKLTCCSSKYSSTTRAVRTRLCGGRGGHKLPIGLYYSGTTADHTEKTVDFVHHCLYPYDTVTVKM